MNDSDRAEAPQARPGLSRSAPVTLLLEDGTEVHGRAIGVAKPVCGEVVFNTSMTGYQEVLTDPSYTGQIVTMTYPHIGNYGINAEDRESKAPCVEGFIAQPRLPALPRGKRRSAAHRPEQERELQRVA